MKHSEDMCVLTQESIAWGENLSNEAQKHVDKCSNCSEAVFQFTCLDSLVEEATDMNVPANFTNNVMAAVKDLREAGPPEMKERPSWTAKVYGFRPFQFAAAGVAIALGIGNISRVLLSLFSVHGFY